MAKSRILLVEGDRAQSQSIQSSLRRLGYIVTSSSNISEAIEKAVSHPHDLALIDVHLRRGTDGLSAARQITARTDTPIVFLAHQISISVMNQMKASNPLGYIQKPVADAELEAVVEFSLNTHAALMAANERLNMSQSILQTIPDGIIVADRGGVITSMNAAAEGLTGWRSSQACGQKLADIFQISSEDTRKPVKISMAQIIREGTASRLLGRAILARKDRSEIHVDDSAAAITDSSGRIIGLVLAFRDITERLAMTEHLLSSQRTEAISNMAEAIARDFGNIMGVITGYATSMADSLISETRAHEDATKIVETSKQAYDLINRLLSVSRVSRPDTDDKVEPVEINDAIADALKLSDELFQSHHITVTTRGQDQHMLARANMQRLLDVLICLFSNAADAIGTHGDLQIAVSSRNIKKPSLRNNPSAKPGAYVVLRVTDTGSGMARQVANHVFEPFYTTKDPTIARGLGLTVVQSSLVSWGGWASVKSSRDKGTTFSLYIPQAKRTRKIQKAVTASPAGKHVLVIDDSAGERVTISAFLREAGFTVLTASSADEGLASYKKNRAKLALVMIDLVMPDRDGKEVFSIIRETDPKAGIVMISGFSRDYVRNYLGLSGWGYVQKPVEKDQLMTAVLRVLEQRAAVADSARTSRSS